MASRTGWRSRVVPWSAWWVVSLGLWEVLSDKRTVAELLTGSAAAALAATTAEVLRARSDAPLVWRARWLLRGAALPGRVLVDTARIFGALAATVAGRPPRSGFHEVAVHPRSEAWGVPSARALLVLASSVSPNSLVLGFDEDRGVLVLHHLVAPGSPA